MTTEHEELTKVEGGWLTPDRNVRIEQSDIEHGRARDQWGCAIVRAIQRIYPDALRVRVNAKYIGFTIGEERFTYPTPPEAIDAIIRPFDQGKTDEIESTTIRLRAGKVKDVEHNDERTLQRVRDHKRQKGASERQQQMSPSYHEYERF